MLKLLNGFTIVCSSIVQRAIPVQTLPQKQSAASIAAEPPSLPLGPRSLPSMLMRLCNGPYPHGPKKALGDTRYAFPLLISPVGG